MTALVQLYAPDIPPADYDCSASVVTDEGEISRCAICLEGPCAKGERSHRRDCHSADAPSPSLLNYIRREREVQQNDSLVNGQVSATQSPPDAATNSARCGTSQTWTMLRHDCPNHLGLCAPPQDCLHASAKHRPTCPLCRTPLGDMLLVRGTLTTWTILQNDDPNHLGLWYNALPEHQTALIASGCACPSRPR